MKCLLRYLQSGVVMAVLCWILMLGTLSPSECELHALIYRGSRPRPDVRDKPGLHPA